MDGKIYKTRKNFPYFFTLFFKKTKKYIQSGLFRENWNRNQTFTFSYMMCNKINLKEKKTIGESAEKCLIVFFLELKIFFYKRKCNVRSVTDFTLN